MKRLQIFSPMMSAVIACVLCCGPLSVAKAEDVDLRRLLHGPDRCDHVISLLLRHGVNNDADIATPNNAFHPLGPVAIPAADLGDLQLISIARHGAIADGCGPAFDLVIKNCSTRDVCGSRVTIVGLFGRIHPTSPNVTARIDSIPAGQAVQVTVTLPIECLAMGNLNGQMIAFNRVLVAVDSFDQFMECNEANNLRVFDAGSISMISTEVGVAQTEVVSTESVAVSSETIVDSQSVVGEPSTNLPAGNGTEVNATAVQPQPSAPTESPSTAPGSGEQSEVISQSDLQSAINQFTDDATTQQEAS